MEEPDRLGNECRVCGRLASVDFIQEGMMAVLQRRGNLLVNRH